MTAGRLTKTVANLEPPLWSAAIARAVLVLLCGCALALVAGCTLPEAVKTTATVQDPTEVKYYPSDEPLRMGEEQFGRGNFGLAQRYFRDAVEKAPKDATAWIGLAASYDRLRRFDLADQAYAQAIALTGETVQILNNEGYSYMLRGDLERARRKLLRARELDPGNPTIADNIELLNGSARFIERPPPSYGWPPSQAAR
jgi:Flp pilus assembly protein TadD